MGAGVEDENAARMLLLSDELISCCVVGANGCLDLTRRAFALGRQVNAEWSRCTGSTARLDRGSGLHCHEAQQVG